MEIYRDLLFYLTFSKNIKSSAKDPTFHTQHFDKGLSDADEKFERLTIRIVEKDWRDRGTFWGLKGKRKKKAKY